MHTSDSLMFVGASLVLMDASLMDASLVFVDASLMDASLMGASLMGASLSSGLLAPTVHTISISFSITRLRSKRRLITMRSKMWR
jgi:uncharacterized protein YjbI with pentapeptide repeats